METSPLGSIHEQPLSLAILVSTKEELHCGRTDRSSAGGWRTYRIFPLHRLLERLVCSFVPSPMLTLYVCVCVCVHACKCVCVRIYVQEQKPSTQSQQKQLSLFNFHYNISTAIHRSFTHDTRKTHTPKREHLVPGRTAVHYTWCCTRKTHHTAHCTCTTHTYIRDN